MKKKFQEGENNLKKEKNVCVAFIYFSPGFLYQKSFTKVMIINSLSFSDLISSFHIQLSFLCFRKKEWTHCNQTITYFSSSTNVNLKFLGTKPDEFYKNPNCKNITSGPLSLAPYGGLWVTLTLPLSLRHGRISGGKQRSLATVTSVVSLHLFPLI